MKQNVEQPVSIKYVLAAQIYEAASEFFQKRTESQSKYKTIFHSSKSAYNAPQILRCRLMKAPSDYIIVLCSRGFMWENQGLKRGP